MPARSLNDDVEVTFPLEQLSRKITKNASIVSQYLDAHHLPQPSFESDGPSVVISTDAPQHIREAKQHLVAECLETLQLALGPSEFVPSLAAGVKIIQAVPVRFSSDVLTAKKFQNICCISWLCQYDLFHLIPLNGAISYGDLEASTGVPEQRLKSVARMAMTNALFCEQSDGNYIGHSATSALLARSADVHAWAQYLCNRSAPIAMQMAAAHRRWGPASVQRNETAYNIAFNTDLPVFEDIARDEARVREFAAYMRNVTSSEGVSLQHLVAGYAWGDVPEGGIVVDVGGSTGSAAIALAEAFTGLEFIVQDLPSNADNGRKSLAELNSPDIGSRVKFQAHDFTRPEPVQGADVYLLRMILHDWPDDEAAEILRHIFAAMRTRSRLLIMDTVLPAPRSVPVSVERNARVRDLFMMQAFNSGERDLKGWKGLLAAVDSRLHLINVVQPFGSDLSVLEVILDDAVPK
ncbi:MAG: hypothetical protein M1831_005446 [Alyxoria varia]|nr:MAG: hypothetical protein M1831_005446 [Alyxoria varia]